MVVLILEVSIVYTTLNRMNTKLFKYINLFIATKLLAYSSFLKPIRFHFRSAKLSKLLVKYSDSRLSFMKYVIPKKTDSTIIKLKSTIIEFPLCTNGSASELIKLARETN